MAITYNAYDHCHYGTAAEKASADGNLILAQATAKFYVYETGKIYVTDGTAWHEICQADA